MNQPSPDQIRQAARNIRQPAVTHGAKLRQALQHVRYSRNEKPGCGAGSLNSSRQMSVTGATDAV